MTTHKRFTGNKFAKMGMVVALSTTFMAAPTFAATGDDILIDDSMEELKETNDTKPKTDATTSQVTVKHVDTAGKELHVPTHQTGKIGTGYIAENVPIEGYEIIGFTKASDGLTEGVYGEKPVEVTFIYDTLENITGGTSKLPSDAIAAPSELGAQPQGDTVSTAAVGDDILIDDSREDLKDDAEQPAVTPEDGTGAVAVPVTEAPRLTPVGKADPATNPAQAPSEASAPDAVAVPETKADGEPVNVDGQPVAEVDENGDGVVTDRELDEIPQAGAETNNSMVGAGIVALLAAGASLFMRREKSVKTE